MSCSREWAIRIDCCDKERERGKRFPSQASLVAGSGGETGKRKKGKKQRQSDSETSIRHAGFRLTLADRMTLAGGGEGKGRRLMGMLLMRHFTPLPELLQFGKVLPMFNAMDDLTFASVCVTHAFTRKGGGGGIAKVHWLLPGSLSVCFIDNCQRHTHTVCCCLDSVLLQLVVRAGTFNNASNLSASCCCCCCCSATTIQLPAFQAATSSFPPHLFV